MKFLIVPHPNNSDCNAKHVIGQNFFETQEECLDEIRAGMDCDDFYHGDIFYIMDFESSTFSDFEIRKETRLIPINE
jgi:hypothetical protein